SFERVHCLPRPASGAIPIVLGGNSAPAVRRAGRTGDGWFPYTIAPEDFAAAADDLRAVSEAAGRPADAVEITAWPGSCDPAREFDPEFAGRYVACGATRLILSPPTRGPDGLSGPRGLDVLR